MKKILGLDLGTNSIGAALIEIPDKFEDYGKEGKIIWAGSRIIPVDGDMLQKFESGGLVETKAAARRRFRSIRRLNHRYKLRRTRLIKVLKCLGWLNEEFPEDFKKTLRVNPEFKFNINRYIPFEKATVKEAAKELGIEFINNKPGISEDWIVYYLRKKALYKKISMNELVRIIYMMNQRRGFKSGRKDRPGDDETTKDKWAEVLTLDSVEEINMEDLKTVKKGKPKKEFEVKSGKYSWKVQRHEKPEWVGKQFQFLITMTTKNDGSETFKFELPTEDDWTLVKTALEQDIKRSGLHVGEYFFTQLIRDKNYRIRQRVIDRSLYRREFEAIWNKQKEFHGELTSTAKLKELSELLYKVNAEKQKQIQSSDLFNLIANDIIYHQRDLKSQKKLISGCRFEKGKYVKDGRVFFSGYKVAPVSSPEFQEYRILQDIHNIRILQREDTSDGRLRLDVDVTETFVDEAAMESLFDLLDSSKSVSESAVLKAIDKQNLNQKTHRVNLFVNRNELKGNVTKNLFRSVFKKCGFEGEDILNDSKALYRLWHTVYSISSSDSERDEKGIRTALSDGKTGHELPEIVIQELSVLPELNRQYASLSSKAIKKLLPLMRVGTKWCEQQISAETMKRLNMIKAGEIESEKDEQVMQKLAEYFETKGKRLQDLEVTDLKGLPVWLASYIVYGGQTGAGAEVKFNSFEDIDVMSLIPNNSLRNPIVEQVIREALYYVRDIWEKFGQPDEIHIEMAREMKKNAEERKKLSENVNKNFLEKERIKSILSEMRRGTVEFETPPNPDSPKDVEKFRIYESCSVGSFYDFEKEMKERTSGWKFSDSEIRSYALWLEQKCISPYTGKVIPLSKLFTEQYEVEHIIPRSKLKYDSPENLVICESAANKKKGNLLAMEFIERFGGREHEENGDKFSVLSVDEYELHCKKVFSRSRAKLRNLLRTDIPNDFVSRQLNDTRYIARKVAELLSPVAKEKSGIVFTGGGVTSELRQSWGLNEVWKQILRPRFERLEKILGTQLITVDEEDKNKIHLHAPDPKVDIKRVDHRHHAMDALVIAATTREHIRYLNSLSRVDNESELRQVKTRLVKKKVRDFAPPWDGFAVDCKSEIEKIIVTFKANNKIFTKPFNRYFKWELVDGKWKKVLKKQKNNWKWMAVRKSLFKQPQGTIYLKQINERSIKEALKLEIERYKNNYEKSGSTMSYVYDKEVREILKAVIRNFDGNESEIQKYFKKSPLSVTDGKEIKKVRIAEFNMVATKRVRIDKTFTKKKIEESLPYAKNSPVAKMLLKHLAEYNNVPAEAFEGEGLEKLRIKNGGRPLEKVTVYEVKKNMELIDNKLLETDKGGNVEFAVYRDKKGDIVKMQTISVFESIKQILEREHDDSLLESELEKSVLRPNDLVLVSELQKDKIHPFGNDNTGTVNSKVYKIVSFTKNQLFGIPHNIALSLTDDYSELGANNKAEKTWDGLFIKKQFKKLEISRLGEIIGFDD
jgi:CRISPR-associated endonuclease Csn1